MRESPRLLALLWGHEHSRPGPKPRHDVREIARAGIAIADTEGLAALSMSRVAADLGVTPMALYRYVDSKDELLMAMLDTAYGPPPRRAGAGGWRPRLQSWARANHDALLRHPWIVQIPLTDPPLGPYTLAWTERGLAAFDGTALGSQDRLSSLLSLEVYVRGHVLLTSSLGATPESAGYVRAISELADPQQFPALTAAVASGALEDGGDLAGEEFEFGLQTLLDGIAARVDGSAEAERRRHDAK